MRAMIPRLAKVRSCLVLGLATLVMALPLRERSAWAEEVAAFPPEARIVSIGGSLTEIVYALHAESRLVARDSTSTYPKAAESLPSIGYMRQLSPEGVLSLHPGGILSLATSGPPEAVAVLRQAGVPMVEVPEAYDAKGVVEKIRKVGAALGKSTEAEALVTRVEAGLKPVTARVERLAERQRVLFVLSAQGGKIMAAGTGTAADGMIRLSGGINAVEGYAGYKPLSDEALIDARPDLILVMDHAGPGASDADLLSHPGIAATPAGQKRRILRMDGSYLLGFGPRTAEAARDVSEALYGH
ncbi:hemin ABC transporter substrate-binding protein [Xaviernesmea oryzae]|uniref:Hemin ABC transporter substrate-binding protein n=1 Tax=Xaviernesmea oryzae TaxID=464029 RepID=A0A1Q9ARG8_9HYPH|nr:ABC transporter substrate-binding protein [Xaviernesmea oryzae]OLP57971.1 hemin ABC transporter substrate-binding protein [Xaviernesmea oryzae]SEL28501.1 iron complex transport system substrate-binding protein [Xaviernesmea oryzae]